MSIIEADIHFSEGETRRETRREIETGWFAAKNGR